MQQSRGFWRRIGAVLLVLGLGWELLPELSRAQQPSPPPAGGDEAIPGLNLSPPGEAPEPGMGRGARARRPRRVMRQGQPGTGQRPGGMMRQGPGQRMGRAGAKMKMREMGQQDCWACHRLPNLTTDTGNQEVIHFCISCHRDPEALDRQNGSKGFALQVEPPVLRSTRHGNIACTSCHQQVARVPHHEVEPLACTQCHPGFTCPVEAEAHPGMECALCHVSGNVVKASGYMDPATGLFVNYPRMKVQVDEKNRISAHSFTLSKPCRTCHAFDNAFGAPYPRLFVLAPWTLLAAAIGLLGLLLRVRRAFDRLAGGKPSGSIVSTVGALLRLIFGRGILDLLGIAIADLALGRRYLKESILRGLAMILFAVPFVTLLTLAGLKALGLVMGWDCGWVVRLTHDPSARVTDLLVTLAGLALVGLLLSMLLRRRTGRAYSLATPGDQPWAAAAIFFFMLATLYSLLLPMPALPQLETAISIGWYLGKIGSLVSLGLLSWGGEFLGSWAEPLAERIAREAARK